MTFRYSELKLWLLLMMFLISWQSIFNQGVASTLLHFFDILHRSTLFYWCIVLCLLSFLGEKIGEELLSVSFVLTLITISSYLLSPSIFLFLSLFASFFLNLVPLILLILYHKELKSKLKYQRRKFVDISFDIASFLFLFVYQYEGLRSDKPSLVSWDYWNTCFFASQNNLLTLFRKR